jgi:agmatinase
MDSDEQEPLSFLGLEGPDARIDRCSAVILPIPFERSTSYGIGTAAGPAAILAASQQVELFDEELQCEPYRVGIGTLPPLIDTGQLTATYFEELCEVAGEHLRRGRFLVALGGEHSLTAACVRAAQRVHGQIGVVQFDAHADLRDTYEGDPASHACVMRRIHEKGIRHLALGIRSLSAEEVAFLDSAGDPPTIVWGRDLCDLSIDQLERHLDRLPEKIYLTFDVDFFDPSLLPATGTPEPGGGFWWPTLALLRTVFERKEVVAMDLVELAPQAGQIASDFTIARLAYKCIAYAQLDSRRRRSSTS